VCGEPFVNLSHAPKVWITFEHHDREVDDEDEDVEDD